MTEYSQDPPAWVRPYIGIPYRKMDCWQLCCHVAKQEAGVDLPTFLDEYERFEDESLWDNRLRGKVADVVNREKNSKGWRRVAGDPRPLDIALYRILGNRWHVATVLGGGWALNTDTTYNSHALRLDDSKWTRLLEGYYRYER